jgi:uracil-DNA glycosylase
LATAPDIDAEIKRRKNAYPDIPVQNLYRGAPVVGKSGALLNQWVLPQVGLRRDELFIDNTLRCLPPRVDDKNYPVGDEKKQAERCCRHYDRLREFKPDALVMTIHPAALLREVTPLPLMVKDMEKARDFSVAGAKTLIFMGGKAAKAFMRYGENIARWRGSYEVVRDAEAWYESVIEHHEKGITGERKKRSKRALFADDPNDTLDFLGSSSIKRIKIGTKRVQCTGTLVDGRSCTKFAKSGEVMCGTHLKKKLRELPSS